MTIHVNGEPKEIAENATLKSLLQSLALDSDGIAVAMDHRVIPRSEHATTTIPQDAKIEIIRAVGGG